MRQTKYGMTTNAEKRVTKGVKTHVHDKVIKISAKHTKVKYRVQFYILHFPHFSRMSANQMMKKGHKGVKIHM